jgi:hypothetical protein
MVAASAVVHLAVLALVGLSAPKLAFRVSPPEPAIEVWLTPDVTPLVHRRTSFDPHRQVWRRSAQHVPSPSKRPH